MKILHYRRKKLSRRIIAILFVAIVGSTVLLNKSSNALEESKLSSNKNSENQQQYQKPCNSLESCFAIAAKKQSAENQ